MPRTTSATVLVRGKSGGGAVGWTEDRHPGCCEQEPRGLVVDEGEREGVAADAAPDPEGAQGSGDRRAGVPDPDQERNPLRAVNPVRGKPLWAGSRRPGGTRALDGASVDIVAASPSPGSTGELDSVFMPSLRHPGLLGRR